MFTWLAVVLIVVIFVVVYYINKNRGRDVVKPGQEKNQIDPERSSKDEENRIY
jgi:hypothetical protein